MTHPAHAANRPTPPALSELFAEYLRGQTAAQSEGLGFAELGGEVEPYESVPVQPVDPKQAWMDALAAADLFGAKAAWTTPPDWPVLVAGQEPAVALAFCLGNYPQMVRNLHPLLAGGDMAALRAGPTRARPPRPWSNRRKRPAAIPKPCWRPASCAWPGNSTPRRSCWAAPPSRRRPNGGPSTPMKRRRWPGTEVKPRKPRRCGRNRPTPSRSCSTAAWPPCSWAMAPRPATP